MFCSACGNPLKLGARYCSTCGAADNPDSVCTTVQTFDTCRFCPGCGLVQSRDGRFCQHCSACSQCGVRRARPLTFAGATPGRAAPTGDHLAAIALDGLLIPYMMLYAIPFLPSMLVWWWTVLVLWCGNIVAGYVTGQTLGKRILHIRTARAGSGSARRISRGLAHSNAYALTGGQVASVRRGRSRAGGVGGMA